MVLGRLPPARARAVGRLPRYGEAGAHLAVQGWDSVMVFLHGMAASGFWSCLVRAEPPQCAVVVLLRGVRRDRKAAARRQGGGVQGRAPTLSTPPMMRCAAALQQLIRRGTAAPE